MFIDSYSNTGLQCIKVDGQRDAVTNTAYLEMQLDEFKVVQGSY